MQKDNLRAFMDLILYDQSMIEYENQLDLLYEEMGTIERKKSIQTHELTKKQNELIQVKKLIKTCEEELNDAIAQEKKISEAHKDVHDKREYIAYKKELDHYHALQQSLEKRLLSTFAQAETLEKEVKVVMGQATQDTNSIENLVQECRKKIEEIENAFEEAKNQRESFESHVPLEWRTRYEQMRHEVPDPIAFLMEESCSRCFQILTPYELIQINKGPLTCKGCYRFLCVRPE